MAQIPIIGGSLIGKFLIAIVTILLLTGAIGGVFYSQIDAQLQSQVDDQIDQTTGLHTTATDQWLQDRNAELQEVQRSNELTSGDNEERSEFLEDEARSTGFDQLHLVDSQSGEVVASSDSNAVGSVIAGDGGGDMNPDILTGVGGFTRQSYTSPGGAEAVAMVRPRAQTDLVLVGEFRNLDQPPRELARSLSEHAYDGGNTVIVNGDGERVFGDRGAPDGLELNDDDTNATIQDIGENKYKAQPVSEVDEELYVLTITPRSEALAVRNQVIQNFGLTLLFTGIVLLAVSVVGGRRIVGDIDRLADRATEMEQGEYDVDLSTSRGDEIGTLYRSFASMRDSLKQSINEAEQAREEAEAERQRVQRINDELEAAAEEYCAVMGAAANGDLTVRADVDTDNESMRTIGEDFNAMLDDIEATMSQVQAFAHEVATASEEVTASSEEVKSASEQVSRSIQKISDGSERQNESLQNVTAEMEDLSTTTEEIAASANQVANTAERTAETGQEGREAAERAIAGVNRVQRETEEAVDQIERLEEEVGQIDDLIGSIAEIADQTNMLALNANIEASRADSSDSEEGFGVVAEEVKQLSEDAKNAADEVEERLGEIRKQTERSAEEVEEAADAVATQADTIKETVNALDEIADYAEETNTGVQEISAATEQQAATTQEVVAMVDEATDISERTSSESESVAAAAEEQTTAMSEVSDSANNLAGRASRLSETLDNFQTRDEMGADAAPAPESSTGPDDDGAQQSDSDGDRTADIEGGSNDPEQRTEQADGGTGKVDDDATDEFQWENS